MKILDQGKELISPKARMRDDGLAFSPKRVFSACLMEQIMKMLNLYCPYLENC